jgi:hypothetical protein
MAIPTIEEWRNNQELLDYYAEWHDYFPWRQRWNYSGGGEEFLYFHRQLLAWYAAERVGRGLSLVPDWDVSQPIVEGHTNLNRVIRPPNWRIPWNRREPFALPSWFTSPGGDSTYSDPGLWLAGGDQHARDTTNVNAPSGQYGRLSDFPDVDTLGKALEHPWHTYSQIAFGALFAAGLSQGDMACVPTAIRDAFFFIWHRHIDNVWRMWSELPEVQLPEVQAVPVKVLDDINSPDVIIRQTAIEDAAAELGNFGDLTPESDDIIFGQTAYLYARVENMSDQPVTGRFHFFYAPVSLAHHRRYWVEIPLSNAGRWGRPIYLNPGEKQVLRSGPMSGVAVWHSRFIPAPNMYRLLAVVVPDEAPRGYPFERALPPGSSVETLTLNNDWMASRDFEVLAMEEAVSCSENESLTAARLS